MQYQVVSSRRDEVKDAGSVEFACVRLSIPAIWVPLCEQFIEETAHLWYQLLVSSNYRKV